MLPNVMRALLLALLSTSLALPAMAQDDKRASREREALRRAQQQVQKSTQDLSALQQKFDAAEQERAKLADEVGGAQTQAKNEAARGQRLQRDLQTVTREREALQARSAEQERKLQELTAKLAQLDRDLVSARQRGQQLDTQGAGLREQVAACENRNTQLYATGRSLIEQCRDRSAKDTLLRLEPFTGMGRVGIENMLETHRDKLDEHKTPARLPAN
ncbi:MAG: hypothetical protein DCF26_14045 [Burkholderiales bacterium]|nr:MAG: hypothetical protein DCF26_14045 [Burkholderiales bacterium]